MDIAWDVQHQVVVAAIELSTGIAPNSDVYECTVCGGHAWPVALDSESRIAPHFSARHRDDCHIQGDPSYVHGGGPLRPARSRLSAAAGYPARLVIPEEREQVDPDTDTSPARQSTTSSSRKILGRPRHGTRPTTAATIRPFCSTFIRYPHDRADLSIQLPGVDGYRYQYAFKRLDHNAIRDYPNLRIFYAEVAWTAQPHYTAATATVSLYAGDRDSGNRARVINPYQVVIDWSTWDTRLRNALQREIASAQMQARESADPTVRSWMFFLAAQDPFAPTTFRLDSHAYYCFIAAEIRTFATKSQSPGPRRRSPSGSTARRARPAE